jgi:hypothetical protein
MQTKNTWVIYSVCMILLAVCMVSTGCTSGQSGATASLASTSPATIAATPSQTTSSTTVSETILTTTVPHTVATAVTSSTGTPANNAIEVTLNSAEKQTSIGTVKPKESGRIYLILDVTIKNNDKTDDFEYTNASFALYDKTIQQTYVPVTSIVAGGLSNPFTTGMVPLKSEKTGQVVFSVKENSDSYKFTIYDSKGMVITSFDTVNVS